MKRSSPPPAASSYPTHHSTWSSTGSSCTTSRSTVRLSRTSPRRRGCLVASGVYFLNDAKDVELDRAHPTKRLRPIAAGIVPVGLALTVANRVGAASAIHGTPDDIPLSPPRLIDSAHIAGLIPELHAVTYSWRRLPRVAQDLLAPLDSIGSRPRSAPLGHTLMLIARKP